MDAEIRFTKTERGKSKLIYRGYMYNKHRIQKNGTVWRCDLRSECNSTITISHDQQSIIKEPTDHSNHSVNWGRVQAKECMEAMKDRARTSREPIASIIQNALHATTSEANISIPKKSSIKRVLRLTRRENIPPDAQGIDELQEIDARYTRTLEGNRWLLHFDPQAEEKLIILVTDNHLKYLTTSNHWIMDGTFKISPRTLLQLYTIHVRVFDQWFPMVMVLMQRKTRQSYEILFQVLKDAALSTFQRHLSPYFISVDYENTVISVIKAEFSEARISGCLFHLGQSFWRRLQAEGLASEYVREGNEEIRAQFHSLIALSFVPEEDVVEAFEELEQTVQEDLIPLFDYVEDNYIKGRRRGRGRQQPLYPPQIWNCYIRTLENVPRTINTCEGWHSRINTIMGKAHPSLYHLLELLQREVGEIEKDIERLQAGHSPPLKRKKYIQMDTRITRIVQRYGEYKAENNILTYLRAIGHNISGTMIN